MKIEIVVSDKKYGKARIPLTRKEIGAMYDAGFMLSDETMDTMTLNKVYDDFIRLHKKFLHLEQDIIAHGQAYDLNSKKMKKRMYLIKKPKWEK